MRTLFALLIAVPVITAAQTTPTNISVTNAIADQLLRGNYNPSDYLPSTIITDPDEIVCHIERETSADSLLSFLQGLTSFHTRHTYSDTVSSDTGIGAARKWIYSKFNQFSQRNQNRLVPAFMQFDITGGLCGDGTFRNIFAVLPGRDTSDPSFVLIEAHADSRCEERCDITCSAHGADDNGSGTALVLELARVMSELSFDHTIVFMATVGEEQGLYGADAFSKYCKDNGIAVKAVQNNDIVGGVLCGHTASPPGCTKFLAIDSTQLRIFSFGNTASNHKGYARFVKMTYEENLLPIVSVPMAVSLMAPEDRSGRGGDHIPFRQRGYTAVRFTSANEYGNGAPDSTYMDHQHTSEDIIGYDTDGDQIIDSFLVDFNYLRRNSIINGVGAAMAAIGPDRVDFAIDATGGNVTINITDPNSYNHYRVALRDPSENDFNAVYTVKNNTSFVLPNISTGTSLRVSVAAVDGLGVMGLFATEQFKTVTTTSTNPNVDTLEFRGVNCWPAGVEPPEAAIRSGIRMRIAPNPFEDETYLLITSDETQHTNLAVRITETTGRLVESRQVDVFPGTTRTLRIDGSSWSTGIYLVTLFSEGKPILKETVTHFRR